MARPGCVRLIGRTRRLIEEGHGMACPSVNRLRCTQASTGYSTNNDARLPSRMRLSSTGSFCASKAGNNQIRYARPNEEQVYPARPGFSTDRATSANMSALQFFYYGSCRFNSLILHFAQTNASQIQWFSQTSDVGFRTVGGAAESPSRQWQLQPVFAPCILLIL
jgi:hypothetical protein